jgi:gas vesicle protein
MSRHRNHGKSGFAIGAIFGGIVGGLTALLFAPKSGNKLRKDIANRYHDVSGKASEMLNDVCSQTCDLVEKAKDIACSAKEAASKIYRKD